MSVNMPKLCGSSKQACGQRQAGRHGHNKQRRKQLAYIADVASLPVSRKEKVVSGALFKKPLKAKSKCNLFKFKLSHETSTIFYTQSLAYA